MEATTDQVLNMEHWTPLSESIHEFKVFIKTADFEHILEHARLNKEASKANSYPASLIKSHA